MFSFRLLLIFIIMLFPLMETSIAIAHGGGLDAHGCHRKRATGQYHCHRPQGIFTAEKIRRPGERGLNYYKDFETTGANFYKPKIVPKDGVCSCVRNRVCIGKRGGRYCINGSGNKRYF